MICFVSYQLTPNVSQLAAMVWAGFMSLVFLFRLAAISWVLQQKGDFANKKVVSVVMNGTGLTVGVAALVAMLAWFPSLSEGQRGLMTLSYVSWIAGGMASQSCYPRWTPLWSVPILLSCVIAWALIGGIEGWGISALLLVLFALMVGGLMTSARSIKESILAKLDNREMAR